MKDFSASTVITVFFLVMCLGRECWTQVDLTLVPREQGSDVVHAVVAKIEDSGFSRRTTGYYAGWPTWSPRMEPTVILIGLKIAITAESGSDSLNLPI